MASLLRRSCQLAPTRRAFSTSTPRLASLQWDRNNNEALADAVPEYPYGPPTLYKQSRRGLYGEQRIRFGNNVSVKGKNKSRRSWRPNIVMKRLFSKALNRHVQVRVSARVLRTMDKLGGLDEYLLGEKETRIRELGESGWWLRWAIMQTQSVKNRFAAEREALGLPASREELSVEEEDAEATLAASIPDNEIAELTLEENVDLDAEPEPFVSDVVAEDDAFQVEQSKDLPPLRFRIGRNKYIMLTENGWRNMKPSSASQMLAEKLEKDKIRHDLQGKREHLMSAELGRIKKKLKETNVEYQALVEEQRPVEDGKLDGNGKPVMYTHQEYETRTRPLTTEEMESLDRQIETAAKRAVKVTMDRIVQAKYDAPAKRLQARQEQMKKARAEKAKLVEADVAV